ncbi:RNA polymerase sigma-70 factor [Marivirga lumbricoides]|uniref:RNA polymerase sigma-70 factor n=1 Tax=Marivirga lumbricoides TaxID=1046115 RepID=A0ABQ1LH27_9BACT|nr:RNA polymerase sigma-70 factor [Marivirga lumbricoides]
MSDGEMKILLSQFQNGDKEAFEIIYNLYWKELYFHAYKRLGDEDHAEELVQELFVQLWEKRAFLAIEKSLKAYLFGNIKNRILHFYREKYKQSAHYEASSEGTLEFNSDTEQGIIQRDLLEKIDLLTQKLPSRSRDIFELSRKKFLSNKEIAEKLNISEKTVQYHIHISLKYLRANCPDYLLYSFLLLFWW